MKKWLKLALLLLFVYDVGVDAVAVGDHQGKLVTQTCQSSVCQNHMVTPRAATFGTLISQPGSRVASNIPSFYKQLFDKTVFHVPKAIA